MASAWRRAPRRARPADYRDAWDRLEVRYLRGLNVHTDQRVGALGNVFIYAAGAEIWWVLAPAMPVYGWHRTALWVVSFFLAYMALRYLAVFHASWLWLERQHCAAGHPGQPVIRQRAHRKERLSPLSRIRAKRRTWRHDTQ